jgi:hypothetical protein
MAHIFSAPPEPKTSLGRHRILSPTAGVRVSPLALGAGSIGEAWKGILGSMVRLLFYGGCRWGKEASIDTILSIYP